HEARAGFRLARLRQLHPADAARAPCDAAAADRRVEECKPVCRHGREMLDHVAIASNRPCIETLAPRSGERVARAQRGPGEGQPISHTSVSPTSYLLSPLTRLAASRLGTLSPLRGARVRACTSTRSGARRPECCAYSAA